MTSENRGIFQIMQLYWSVTGYGSDDTPLMQRFLREFIYQEDPKTGQPLDYVCECFDDVVPDTNYYPDTEDTVNCLPLEEVD